MLDRITPLILTFNEAPNIGRTLERLTWAREVVVVDSGSTDRTRDLLRQQANVRVFERPFTTHMEQWNYGLAETEIRTDWVLGLDADYILSEELVHEIGSLSPPADVSGYRARFVYCIHGAQLRSGIYPPVVVLFRRAQARYAQDGHTQRVCVPGRIEDLQAPIFHDDRKPLGHWIAAQQRYMRLEARNLLSTPASELGFADRLRRLILPAPPAVLFYCLFVRGGILDGRAGLVYALQRAGAELMLSFYLLCAMLGIRR
jgi:glycosyltransferase involved in cell wall biosynthesis